MHQISCDPGTSGLFGSFKLDLMAGRSSTYENAGTEYSKYGSGDCGQDSEAHSRRWRRDASPTRPSKLGYG